MSVRHDDLKGAAVFITGGGSGIGAALTAGFLAQGAKVTFVGRSDYSDFVEDMAQAHGNRPRFIRCDVTDTAALHAAMQTAHDADGGLRVLVNNAANDLRMETADVTHAEWQEMIDVNLKPYFFACQKAGALMGDGGAIVNFSSLSYLIGSTGMVPYVSSNAGIMGMTRALAREWGPRGIRVNAVAPGWVLTEKQKDKWATPEALAAFLDRQCLKRHLDPDDIVGPVLFLASRASAMVTAQTLVVDGGVAATG